MAMDPELYDPVFGRPSADFFDYGPVWDQLKNYIITDFIFKQPKGAELKAWVMACSTGQVAYSLAIVFREVLKLCRPHSGIKLQVFGTDINSARLEFAKRAIYPKYQVLPGKFQQNVSEERRKRFFNKSGEGYQVKDEIRQMVKFELHDVLTDPPLAGNSFISCSNFVHWIDFETQKRLVTSIYDNLISGGVWWHLHKIFYKNAGFDESKFEGWFYLGPI